ncbi:MAG: cellobiose phosphorylase [Chloroflexota bacterium]
MSANAVKYFFDPQGRFVVENYNWAEAFSNFLPGIAGKWGIPMWVYYVSKAQGICSAGVKDKDHAILEFLSFNKACQVVGKQIFRTFIKLGDGRVHEPFQKVAGGSILQRMMISSHELELYERNHRLELEVNVIYYPLVHLPLAGLVRQVTFRNLSHKAREVEVLDGVARLLPLGVSFEQIKGIARHIEGMMGVFETAGFPLFRLKQISADIEEVGELQGGNYYVSLTEEGELLDGNIIVDPRVVFGEIENHDFPWVFTRKSIESIFQNKQVRENRTPCAFTGLTRCLLPGESFKIYSILGNTTSESVFLQFIDSIQVPDFFPKKREENREVIGQIKNPAFTLSSENTFDQYCQQTFLDNVLRGGLPLHLGGENTQNIFYMYGRQGGDPERDYHWFLLEPTYLSQGNGHYRSVLQNRRMDAWFFPDTRDHNIVTFMNLLQTDGYNPLVVNAVTYAVVKEEEVKRLLNDLSPDKSTTDVLYSVVKKPFTPGEFIMVLEKYGCQVESYEDILGKLLPLCRPNEIGGLHEGYWIDHWFYNLDLIESYISIYPDRIRELLLDKRVYTFYDNPDVVQPRAKKCILVNGKVRQYRAVVRHPEKVRLIYSRSEDACKVRTGYGTGEIYYTNLLVKLLCLVANKVASLDPQGIGIEMEAGKPGWCDSLNGLPGLFGSSVCETLELIRTCRLLLEYLSTADVLASEIQKVFEELYTFIMGLTKIIDTRLASKQADRGLVYWQEGNNLKEEYRGKVIFGIKGEEREMTIGEIRDFITKYLRLLEAGLTESSDKKLYHPQSGVPFTYFINEVVDYRPLPDQEDDKKPAAGEKTQRVEPLAFRQIPLALFLEGPVHYIRVYPDKNHRLYEGVRSSGLYDRKLHMYKCCESLIDQPLEIGRIKAYSSGWIENESVYTHMEYKWLLELLRSGLFDQFFEEFKKTLTPFLDPQTYGRSTLENSSFIVGSAHLDVHLHGRGYQPRFSGVTCEMLNIWTLMVSGERPFYLSEGGKLCFALRPIIPGWLFTDKEETRLYWNGSSREEITFPKGCFAFKLFGKTLVVYHNPKQQPTYGPSAVGVKSYTLQYQDGDSLKVGEDFLEAPLAVDVREGRIRRMDVLLD